MRYTKYVETTMILTQVRDRKMLQNIKIYLYDFKLYPYFCSDITSGHQSYKKRKTIVNKRNSVTFCI